MSIRRLHPAVPPLAVIATLALLQAGLATAPTGADAAQQAPAGGLDVQPFPGTPDAAPQTEIGFPSLARADVRSVLVVGSRSGTHDGRLVALPGGHGTAFYPRRRFTPGERVSVTARLSSAAAGTATGAPGARRISFAFTVAVPGRASTLPAALAANGPPLNVQTQHFHSETWLHPPTAWISGTEPDPAQGDIFADAENSIQPGPLIYGPQGQLIYFQPLQRSAAFNVEVQSYLGQTVLTYWQGYVENGVGIGRDVILDHSYRRVATVYAGHGYSADLHEFQITPRGDALITAYAPVRANLSSVGGPRNGTLMDSIIQEIDIATGQVLWEWHALGHVRLRQSYAPLLPGHPYDYFHINSIQQLPGDRLLISARETWALYELDMRTGRVVLTIGGKRSSFAIGRGANFEWQHDARMQPDGTITLFDNATDGISQDETESRALRIRLDVTHRRITLVRAYASHPPQLSQSQGDVQLLSDGSTFVGWGAAPYLTEFGAAGRERFSMRFPWQVQSYRSQRFQWWGQPATPPSVAATPTSHGTDVYASWDGATDVVGWRVLAGTSADALTPMGQFPDSSFETTMPVTSTDPYFAVQALDGSGNVLGTSATIAR